jgi:hypothetical protein
VIPPKIIERYRRLAAMAAPNSNAAPAEQRVASAQMGKLAQQYPGLHRVAFPPKPPPRPPPRHNHNGAVRQGARSVSATVGGLGGFTDFMEGMPGWDQAPQWAKVAAGAAEFIADAAHRAESDTALHQLIQANVLTRSRQNRDGDLLVTLQFPIDALLMALDMAEERGMDGREFLAQLVGGAAAAEFLAALENAEDA